MGDGVFRELAAAGWYLSLVLDAEFGQIALAGAGKMSIRGAW
jgi:hypothetical protein